MPRTATAGRRCTWLRLEDVAAMAARGLFLQMHSQIGQQGENEFDNLDEVLSGITDEGQGTFFGSFGVADLIWDAPVLKEHYLQWITACDLIQIGFNDHLLHTIEAPYFAHKEVTALPTASKFPHGGAQGKTLRSGWMLHSLECELKFTQGYLPSPIIQGRPKNETGDRQDADERHPEQGIERRVIGIAIGRHGHVRIRSPSISF